MRPALTVLGRTSALAVTAASLALLDLPGRPATLCLLRALTGVPCPLCGGTTAAVELARLRPLAALAASPLVVSGAAALALAPLAPARLTRWLADRRTRLLAGALAAGELWQLARLT